jgi:hypothetical protein
LDYLDRMTSLAEIRPDGVVPSPSGVPRRSGWRHPSPSLRAHGLGLLVALATLAVMMWDLGRPGLWLDESASVAATQRTWPHLWLLLQGSDAPLVPYYVLLKLFTSAITAVVPSAASSPEVLYRLLSVVATVGAAWALTEWLARRCPARLVLSIATALLATGGISRYGQEARPYALTLLMAVICTIVWARMVRDRSRRWVLLYALTVLLLVAAHLLAGSLVAAHLVAALIATPRSRRSGAAQRTAVGAVLGLALVSPFALSAARQGEGPTTHDVPVTREQLTTIFVHVFTNGGPQFLGIGAVLVLAVIGMSQVFLASHRSVARLAAAWALVPPAVLLPVVMLRSNLLIGRYLIFVVPGWAILSGLGVLTLVDLARRLLGLGASRTASRPRLAVLGALVSTALTGAILAALVASQLGTLRGVRTPGGHSEDIRAALAAADRPQYADLPIFLSSVYSSLEMAPYHRADETRLVGQHTQRDQTSIWPVVDPGQNQLWVGHPRLILLLRAPSPAKCKQRSHGTAADYITRCMPPLLKGMGYRVESAQEAGHRWTFAVLSLESDQPLTP